MAVYFAQRPSDGLVKIGWSRHLEARKASLQQAHKQVIEFLRVVETDDREAERWCHDRFAGLRVIGEWFRLHPDMMTIEVPAFPKPEPVEEPPYFSGEDVAILQKRLRLNRAQFARVLDISASRLDDYKGRGAPLPAYIIDRLETMARYVEVCRGD